MTSEANSVVSIESTGGIATVGPDAEVIIKGGTHTSSGSTLYESTGGKITITAGEFKSTSETGPYMLLNGNKENINVSGGTFYKWDPSNGDKTFTDSKNFLLNLGTDFTNVKYVVIPNNPYPNWYYVGKQYSISNNTSDSQSKVDIKEALSDPDITIIDIDKNIPMNEQLWIEKPGDLTINMNNSEFTGASGGYSGAVVYNTHLTINDGTFKSGFQVAYRGTVLKLNDCNIEAYQQKSGSRYCLYVTNYATVEINGGTFSFKKNTSNNDYNRLSYIHCQYSSTVNIYDGNFGAASQYIPSGTTKWLTFPPITSTENSVVNIYGGNFGFDPSLMSTAKIDTNPGVINVYGGYFEAEVPVNFIPAGYQSYYDEVKNKYTVKTIE